ncbi:MAG: Gfo/Idh/MocA family oxidoreductase [Deinococcales bacterium]|nr:Gfo/Idh/MocA family oxidoreductase [Chitinophagaceae bacterium]
MQIINAALLSYGMSGKVFHAPFIQLHKGFNLVGAWERSKQLIKIDYPDAKSYPSLEALLADDLIKLVVVNTPTNTHFSYTKNALLAGKDVVVEKAFTTTLDEAVDLNELANTLGRKITVFQNRRWDSDFKTVKKVIDDDLLGDITEMEIQFARYNPVLSLKLHKEIPNPGAGIVKDLGPHLIDQALCLFGMPKSVFADFRITRTNSQVEDYFEILLYYPTKRVRLKAGYLMREPVPSYVVHGTKGSFLKSRADVQEGLLLKGFKPDVTDWGTEPESEQGLLHTEKEGMIMREKLPTLQGNYFKFYNQLYQALINNENLPVTAQDGINVMQIIEAAFKSNQQGKVVEL